jgi:hypothetical protein
MLTLLHATVMLRQRFAHAGDVLLHRQDALRVVSNLQVPGQTGAALTSQVGRLPAR